MYLCTYVPIDTGTCLCLYMPIAHILSKSHVPMYLCTYRYRYMPMPLYAYSAYSL